MGRAVILVLDSFGIGATADADRSLAMLVPTHSGISHASGRRPARLWHLPNLARLGLFHASRDSTGRLSGRVRSTDVEIIGAYGLRRRAVEWQGHAERTLGDCRCACDVRLGLFHGQGKHVSSRPCSTHS